MPSHFTLLLTEGNTASISGSKQPLSKLNSVHPYRKLPGRNYLWLGLLEERFRSFFYRPYIHSCGYSFNRNDTSMKFLPYFNKLLTVVCLFFSPGLFAQQSSEEASGKNSLGLYVGYAQVKELNLHPKVHGGASYRLGYSHTKEGSRTRMLELHVGFSRLKTIYEGASASPFIQLGATYSYLFKIPEQDNRLSLSIGPLLSAQYALGYYPNWDDSHLYWADYLATGISGSGSFRTGSGKLHFKAAAPIFSIISRPEGNRPYKIDDVTVKGVVKNMNSHWEPTFLNRMRTFTGEVEYQYPLSSKVSQSVGYSFQYLYMKATTGYPVQNLLHQIGLKIYF